MAGIFLLMSLKYLSKPAYLHNSLYCTNHSTTYYILIRTKFLNDGHAHICEYLMILLNLLQKNVYN